jgi:hypothetical protein
MTHQNGTDSVSSGAGLKKVVGKPFAKGHPFYPARHPYKIDRSVHGRLKRSVIRSLRKEYGPEPDVKQMQHINAIGDLSARLQLLGENADPIAAATLANTIHRHLDALENE